MERLRNRRTVVLHVQQIVAQGSFHAHGDRAGGRTEIDGVFDELVEQLYEQVGRAPNEAGIRGRLERDVRLWKSVAIGGDRRGEELAQIEIHALRLLDALLHPRRGAERAQDGLQAQGAFPRARHVAPLVVAQAFGFEIVQRGTHDGQRRAQLVRQLPTQGAQVLRVFVRRARRRSKARARAPISSAPADSGMSSRIFPSLPTAESAALRKRPMRRLIQVAKPNMMMTAAAVASSVRLNRRVTARSRKASSWSPACSRYTAPRVWPSLRMGAAAVNNRSWLAALRTHSACASPASAAATLLPPSRSGAEDCRGKLEVSTDIKRRYQDSVSSSLAPGMFALKVPATPSFNALASMTVARVPARMNVLNKSARPAVVKNSRPPSGTPTASTPDFPFPRPSSASTQRREPTKLKGMRASTW